VNQDALIHVLHETLWLALSIAGPLLAAGLAVGLCVAVFQAATQIQESTLNFLPKIIAIGAALALLAPWALDKLVSFTTNTIAELAHLAPGAM
jgi:flagellar biosynthetic protein FliQ